MKMENSRGFARGAVNGGRRTKSSSSAQDTMGMNSTLGARPVTSSDVVRGRKKRVAFGKEAK